jgi:hypothetical protein
MLIKQVKVKYRDASYTPEHAGILEATTDVKRMDLLGTVMNMKPHGLIIA